MSMVGEDPKHEQQTPKQGETPKAWAKGVPLCGSDVPQDNGRLKWLLEYMLTIYDRFGDTAVTFDGSWGAAALHVKDKEKTIIARLERELAQMAAQKAELEARLAEAQRDALPISPDLIEAQSFFQINITFHSSRERNEFYRWLIERSPAAERKESGNG